MMRRAVGSDSMLEEFLDEIEMLPSELRRGMMLMRELDHKIDQWQMRSSKLEESILRRAQDAKVLWTDPELQEVLRLFDRSVCNADEKLQVSFQLSDLVRRHCDNLRASIGKVTSPLGLCLKESLVWLVLAAVFAVQEDAG